MKTNLIGSLVMATALFATGASFAATAAGTQPVNASSADMKGAANQKVVFQVSAADPKNVKNIELDRGNNRFGQQPGNGSITGLRIGGGGGLQLLPGLGGDDGVVVFSNDPRDLDITPDGRFLYVLNNVEGSVNGFRVNRNGTLDRVTTTGFVLPVFGLGLAAF